MGFLASIRKALQGGRTASGGGKSAFGDNERVHWIYARCNRCGEPLKGRVDLYNDLSAGDEGGFVVRKGLVGSGKNYCFQTVEVTLHFDTKKDKTTASEVVGGELLTAEAYHALVAERAWQAAEATTSADDA